MQTPKWKTILDNIQEKDYYKNIKQFIAKERLTKTVFPQDEKILRAFHLTPYDKVKVVILGQDPYHNGHAHGLSFSSLSTITPESLKNIFAEANADYFDGQGIFLKNNLTQWATQGVLLLNAVLTVEKGKPGSHADIGWQEFTVDIIKSINEKNDQVVYMLWGNYAKQYSRYIDNPRHLVLTAAHPSPYSADKGFFGCKHFTKCNSHLTQRQNGSKIGINWGTF